jgi:predicted phosphodiesterase
VVREDVKVAFIGDQGYGKDAEAVLKLILNEEADMVLHQGDFDYSDNPDLWMEQIDNILGSSFPYFASVGNHDVTVWKEYQKKLVSRLDNINGATCTGDYGVNSACTYKDIFFVLSGIGTVGTDHVNFLSNALNNTDKVWKICSWHKNQRLMQVGGKNDEVGWGAYETCRQAGAIIATGHEHSYSRTHLMSSFEFQTVASTSNNLILTEGNSFAFVSGIGGESIRATRNNLGNNPWWASVYSRDENATFGALFCSFSVNDDENGAKCYFKDIDGLIVDSFTISYQ